MGIHSVLEDVMAAAVSEKAKGEALERLIKVYLSQDQAWTGRFDAVWLWDEWPGRDGKPDTGIDLVARERDTGNLWAIQSKFYAPEHTLQKSDIDSCYLHILDAYLDDLVLDAVQVVQHAVRLGHVAQEGQHFDQFGAGNPQHRHAGAGGLGGERLGAKTIVQFDDHILVVCLIRRDVQSAACSHGYFFAFGQRKE